MTVFAFLNDRLELTNVILLSQVSIKHIYLLASLTGELNFIFEVQVPNCDRNNYESHAANEKYQQWIVSQIFRISTFPWKSLILQLCGTCHLLGAGFYFSMFQTLILVLNIKALQILFGHYKLEELYLAGKNKCWIYQEKILFFCRTQGGVYIHSDRLTVTSPVLMWVKVWTNFIWINFFLAVTGMKVYCEQ